jgi:hypothetical protein
VVIPLPEVTAAAERLPLLVDGVDLLHHLDLLCEVAGYVVPSCVGVSLTVVVDGEAYTLTATTPDFAATHRSAGTAGSAGTAAVAAQQAGRARPPGRTQPPRADGALDMVEVLEVLDVLDEDRWQFCEQAALLRPVRSSLSMPLGPCTGTTCSGAVELYASDADAFLDVRELLAELFLVPAEELVRNADLSFAALELARALPQRLAERVSVDRAAVTLAACYGWAPGRARARIRAAAEGTGLTRAQVADVLQALHDG